MNDCAVDFLPPDYRERRSRKRIWIIRGSLAVALVLSMAAGSIGLEGRKSSLEQRLSAVMATHDTARARIAQVEELDRRKEELSRRLSVLEDVLARARGSLVLEAIGRSCGEQLRFTEVDVRVNSQGLEPTVELTISGLCASDGEVAALLEALRNEPLVGSARMVFSEDAGPSTTEKKFVISARSPARLSEELLAARTGGA